MASVKKIHLKTEKKHKEDKEEKEVQEATEKDTPNTPERREIEFEGTEKNDEEMKDSESQRPADKKKLTARRIWGPKGSSTSSALYEIAATPQRIDKDTEESTDLKQKHSKHTADKETQELLKQMKELSIKMENEIQILKAAESTSNEQITSQLTSIAEQLQQLTEIAKRHDDEIDDLRGMSDLTHELMIDREAKENNHKMVIKSWPKEATYEDRVRITNWLLYKANAYEEAQQEHGFYSAGRRYHLSPVTILTFTNPTAHHNFEKFAYTSFSAKKPLYYWDAQGNYVQHWKGNWHKLIITNYMGKADLIMNLSLTTALYILTDNAESKLAGSTRLTHRTTDKQLFDTENKKVLAKVTYDKDKGVLALIVQKEYLDVLTANWHEAWRIVHKDHPRYTSYNKYPYAVTFAAAREDELAEDKTE